MFPSQTFWTFAFVFPVLLRSWILYTLWKIKPGVKIDYGVLPLGKQYKDSEHLAKDH